MTRKSPITNALGVAIAAAALTTLSGPHVQAEPIRNVVLVHGAFADGSGWKAVSDILARDGYHVSIVQQPMTSLSDDVAATNRILDEQTGPVVLVGHSYGGSIISQAGNHPAVVALVFIAAFQPDSGESTVALLSHTPPPTNHLKTTKDGFLFLDPAKFHADFAADVPAEEAKFMQISQMPLAGKAFTEAVTHAAWRDKPSWALVASSDMMIAPDLERFMTARAKSTTIEVTSSHVAFLSHPADVAKLIEEAAQHAKP